MKNIAKLLIPIVFFALSGGLFLKIPILGATPVLGLVITCLFAISGSRKDFFYYALVLGVISDMLFPPFFGLYTLGYLGVGFILIYLLRVFAWQKHNFVTYIFMTGFASLLFLFWRFLFYFAYHGLTNKIWLVVPEFTYLFILGQVIYNIIAALFIVLCLDRTSILHE